MYTCSGRLAGNLEESEPSARAKARRPWARLLGLALGVCALAMSSREAAAQDAQCLGNLGCNANDTKITTLTVVDTIDGCSYIGDTDGDAKGRGGVDRPDPL